MVVGHEVVVVMVVKITEYWWFF